MNQTKIISMLQKLTKTVEAVIIVCLTLMMSVILIFATIELAYFLYKSIILSPYYLFVSLDGLMDIFGVFLLILIGIELLHTIKVYLKQNVVHVEVVVLVGIIALARKIVILKIEDLSGEILIAIGVLITALSIAYYLVKKTDLMTISFNQPSNKITEDKTDFKELIEK